MASKLPTALFGNNDVVRRYIFRIAIFACLLIGLITFVSKIPQGAAPAEHATAVSVSSLQNIADNPINAPYKIVTYVSSTLVASIVSIRAVSLAVMALSATALYYVVRLWHTRTVAILVTGLFMSNAFVLGVSRLGTPLIAAFSWFIFMALLLWQVHGNSNKIVPGSVLIALAVLLYIPGALWFFAIFAAFYWDRFRVAYKNVSRRSVFIGTAAGLTVSSPLLYAFYRQPALIREWLLLPEQFDISSIASSALQVPSAFIYKMEAFPLLNVGTLPVFDLATGFLFLFGMYAYSKKMQLDRTRIIIAIGLVGLIIGSFGDNLKAVVVLLPFVFTIVGAGIEYLLDEWGSVFPRNPYAKSFGVLIVTTVVLFGSYYQLTRFLIAWPQTPETRETYSEPRILE